MTGLWQEEMDRFYCQRSVMIILSQADIRTVWSGQRVSLRF